MIKEILKKATSKNVPSGICHHCRKPIENKRRKWYCSDNCKYDHRFFTKPKYYNHHYLIPYLGQAPGGRGQGRRSGGMIRGSMSAYTDQWGEPIPLTKENIERSADFNKQFICLGNCSFLTYDEAIELAEHLNKK